MLSRNLSIQKHGLSLVPQEKKYVKHLLLLPNRLLKNYGLEKRVTVKTIGSVVDISPHGVDKGHALEIVLNDLHIEDDDILKTGGSRRSRRKRL